MDDTMRSYDREAFSGPTRLLPEIPVCGRSSQRAARPGLEPHTHPTAFEICLLRHGHVEWWVEDRRYAVGPGQAFVTGPGERHGAIGSVVHPSDLYWLHYVPEAGDGWVGDDGMALASVMRTLPTRVFDAGPALAESIMAVIEEHRDRGPYAASAARAALHTVLVHLAREAQVAHDRIPSAPVRAAMAWMSEHVETPFGVSDAAAAAGLSPARLQARFQHELTCSVGEYRNRLRLEQAKLLLQDSDCTVTEIAHRLWFASSQYFATFFRQRVGVTPSTYRTHAPVGADDVDLHNRWTKSSKPR